MLTNKICARQLKTLIYTDLPLPIPICRPWTSLGNTVFMQIVSSYNYERLIRSISTPNKYALFLLIFLLLFLRPSFFTPLLPIPSIRTPSFLPLFTYTLYSYLYSYTFIFTPLFLLPLLLLPLFLLPTTLPSICTHNIYAFFSKNFSQKNKYA